MIELKEILKNKKGIMGLDYICVAGVVIALTSYAMTAFYSQGKVMTDDSINNLVEAQTITTPNYNVALRMVNEAETKLTHESIISAQEAIYRLTDTTQIENLEKRLNVVKAKTYIKGLDTFLQDNYTFSLAYSNNGFKQGNLTECTDGYVDILSNVNYNDSFTIKRIVDDNTPKVIGHVYIRNPLMAVMSECYMCPDFCFKNQITYNMYNKDGSLISTYTIYK